MTPEQLDDWGLIGLYSADEWQAAKAALQPAKERQS